MNAPNPSECRSCGAPIYWAETEAGHPHPVDVTPCDTGTAVLRLVVGGKPRLTVRIVPVGQPLQAGEKRRMTHWGTCPNAKQHHKPKPAPAWRPCGYPGCQPGLCDDCDGEGWKPRRGGR